MKFLEKPTNRGQNKDFVVVNFFKFLKFSENASIIQNGPWQMTQIKDRC